MIAQPLAVADGRLQKLFSRSNLSEDILDIIIDTPSHEMTWVNEEKAAELGLVN